MPAVTPEEELRAKAKARELIAPPAAPSAYDPQASSSQGTRRSLFPPLWQRFKEQLEDPTALPQPTGANVTLEDLEKL